MRREGIFRKEAREPAKLFGYIRDLNSVSRGDFKHTHAGIATSLMHREYRECRAVDALQNYESREQRVEFPPAYGSGLETRGGEERRRGNRRKNRYLTKRDSRRYVEPNRT